MKIAISCAAVRAMNVAVCACGVDSPSVFRATR